MYACTASQHIKMNSKEDNKRRRENSSSDSDDVRDENEIYDGEEIIKRKKKKVDSLTPKTRGSYIPCTKFWQMHAETSHKGDEAYQRITWEALKNSIHSLINEVNMRNIRSTTIKLFKLNIIRGRGLLTQSIIQAQAASLASTKVYAALVGVINIQFPNIGELLLKRLVLQFRYGYKYDNTICISSAMFMAHLFNQEVVHEILIIDIIELLLRNPTNISIEVATKILKVCGIKLEQVFKKGTEAIFNMLNKFLHERMLNNRVQRMIKAMFKKQINYFKVESVPKELDLVEAKNQLKHEIELTQTLDDQEILNDFQFDDNYTANENKYKKLCERILSSVSDSDDEENSDGKIEDNGVIIDNTGTNLTVLRRKIYLTIHSSLNFEECAHKLMKMHLKPGHEIDLCHVILDCCAEARIYEKIFSLLAERLCANNTFYVKSFESIFKDSYATVHRLDTNRIRNIAKFFAFMLITDSISWAVLFIIKLNEEDTTSSSRVFIKILFQELFDQMGLHKLNTKLKTESLQKSFATRFAVNFFRTIGLGGLTNDLRKHLKNTQTSGYEDEDLAAAGRW